MKAIKTTLLALALGISTLEACPFMNLGLENPHENKDPENERQLTEGGDHELSVERELQQPQFTGSPAQAIDAARAEILTIMQADPQLGPKFVRLAFHDCVGGLCDGCVDLDNRDNAGLRLPMDALMGVVNFYEEQLTRADIWVLAALAAADRMQGNAPGRVPYPMQYIGRRTCPDMRGGDDIAMPSNHITTEALLEFFAREFDFSLTETVAIMGAHTL